MFAGKTSARKKNVRIYRQTPLLPGKAGCWFLPSLAGLGRDQAGQCAGLDCGDARSWNCSLRPEEIAPSGLPLASPGATLTQPKTPFTERAALFRSVPFATFHGRRPGHRTPKNTGHRRSIPLSSLRFTKHQRRSTACPHCARPARLRSSLHQHQRTLHRLPALPRLRFHSSSSLRQPHSQVYRHARVHNFWRSFGSASRCAKDATGSSQAWHGSPPPLPNPTPHLHAPLRLRHRGRMPP